MVSVERILDYTRLEQEAAAHTTETGPSDWPDKGDIYFGDVSLYYRDTSRPALSNVCLAISSKEKVILYYLHDILQVLSIRCLFGNDFKWK